MIFKKSRKSKRFNPDLAKIDIHKKLTKEEHDFLEILIKHFNQPLSEETLDNSCLPAVIDIEMSLARFAEEYGLSPNELSDTIKTALFGLLRKYAIINLEVNKQAFKHEMR